LASQQAAYIFGFFPHHHSAARPGLRAAESEREIVRIKTLLHATGIGHVMLTSATSTTSTTTTTISTSTTGLLVKSGDDLVEHYCS
jgi:hypothetical protein